MAVVPKASEIGTINSKLNVPVMKAKPPAKPKIVTTIMDIAVVLCSKAGIWSEDTGPFSRFRKIMMRSRQYATNPPIQAY